MDNTDIGKRIKELRKQLGITQLDISEKCGISSGNLSNIENGRVLPSANALVDLSNILNCTTDYILKGQSTTNESAIVFNNEETILLQSYRKLSSKDRKEILGIINLKLPDVEKIDKELGKLYLSSPHVNDSKLA